jgi:hypothetical protein
MNFNKSYASNNDNDLFMRGPNQFLQGLNGIQTQNTQITNYKMQEESSANISNDTNVLANYNVIPNPGLKFNFINKPHKVIIYQSAGVLNTEYTFNLNQNFKDVVNIKLIKGIIVTDHVEVKIEDTGDNIEDTGDNIGGSHPLFYILKIKELNKNTGGLNESINENIDNSFCTLDTYDYIEKNNNKNDDIYMNLYDTHKDEVFFDPPLNNLSKLTYNILPERNDLIDSSSENSSEVNYRLKLEFIIETKDKIRKY